MGPLLPPSPSWPPGLAAQKEEKEQGMDVLEDADAQGDKAEEGGMGNYVSE